MDLDLISEMLEAVSDREQAKKLGRHNKCLRGIRGVASGEIARVVVAAWEDASLSFPRDTHALDQLFGAAFEDGLAAIALLAPSACRRPMDSIHLALKWASQTDDPQTADAIGWALIGPSLLVEPQVYGEVEELLQHHRPWSRRVFVMAAMAALPIPLEGPVACCLREDLGTARVQFVDKAVDQWLIQILNATLRDDAPPVRKAVRRVIGAWALVDPDAAVEWADHFPGGIPKMIRAELEKNAKKGRKRLLK